MPQDTCFSNSHQCILMLRASKCEFIKKITKLLIPFIDFHKCFHPYMHKSLYIIVVGGLHNYSLDSFTLKEYFEICKAIGYFHFFAT